MSGESDLIPPLLPSRPQKHYQMQGCSTADLDNTIYLTWFIYLIMLFFFSFLNPTFAILVPSCPRFCLLPDKHPTPMTFCIGPSFATFTPKTGISDVVIWGMSALCFITDKVTKACCLVRICSPNLLSSY